MREQSPKFNSEVIAVDARREAVKRWRESHKEIRKADPLRADNFFITQFPLLNFYQDRDGIAYAAREIIPTESTLQLYTNVEARAAKRDLTFLATALIYHGGEMRWAEGLEGALQKLSEKTGDVPAHTIFDYSLYNPLGERMRTFTGTEQECFIIEQTHHGMDSLSESILLLDKASKIDIFNPEYASLVQAAASHFGPMRESMVAIRRNTNLVPVFTKDIQPYFMSKITVDGEQYSGAGGGEIPIFMVDRLLGTAPSETMEERKRYEHYYGDNIRYSPVELRGLSESFGSRSSLVEDAISSASALDERSEKDIATARDSVTALRDMIMGVSHFRNPHGRTAEESMKMREIKHGSGGYSVDMLDLLKNSTNRAKQRLDIAATNLNISDWRYTFVKS